MTNLPVGSCDAPYFPISLAQIDFDKLILLVKCVETIKHVKVQLALLNAFRVANTEVAPQFIRAIGSGLNLAHAGNYSY